MSVDSLNSKSDFSSIEGIDNSHKFFSLLNSGNKYKIRSFLEKINSEFWLFVDEEQNNGLHFCVIRDNFFIVKMMFEIIEEQIGLNSNNLKSTDVISKWINSQNIKGDTCLHYAAYKGNYKMVNLLAKYNINAHIKNDQGNTVMHYAAQGNQPGSFVFFNYLYKVSPDEGNRDGSTPLHWCCYTGSEIAFNYIINYFKTLDIQDQDGLTPLHLAVVAENTNLIKKLLHKGVNKNIRDNKGRTARDIALSRGFKNCSILLEEDKDCTIFKIKAPIVKEEKNNFNIYLFVGLHLIYEPIYFMCILPYINSITISVISIILVLGSASLFITLIYKNPGTIRNNDPKKMFFDLFKREEMVTDYCATCAVRIIPNRKHCIICDICIEDFDHHCYWINTCVGRNNVKIFRIFLIFLFLNLLVICIFSFISKLIF